MGNTNQIKDLVYSNVVVIKLATLFMLLQNWPKIKIKMYSNLGQRGCFRT